MIPPTPPVPFVALPPVPPWSASVPAAPPKFEPLAPVAAPPAPVVSEMPAPAPAVCPLVPLVAPPAAPVTVRTLLAAVPAPATLPGAVFAMVVELNPDCRAILPDKPARPIAMDDAYAGPS